MLEPWVCEYNSLNISRYTAGFLTQNSIQVATYSLITGSQHLDPSNKAVPNHKPFCIRIAYTFALFEIIYMRWLTFSCRAR